MDVNKVTLIGRLTRDPESKQIKNGQSLATFTVATNYFWKDAKTKEKKDKTEFHRVVAWGKLAEIVSNYLEKASRIYLEGRLQYRDWEDDKGMKRTQSDIVADEIVMLGHKGTKDASDALVKEEPAASELVVESV